MKLINHFNIADQNITLENYQLQLNSLNSSFPQEVEHLELRTCDLQTFLDQVSPQNANRSITLIIYELIDLFT